MIFYVTTVCILAILLNGVNTVNAEVEKKTGEKRNTVNYKELGDHTLVTDSETFPYVVAILKKTTYLSAGALIDDSWVLTAADALFLVRESTRILRVRLGSINHKKGGILMPIKYIEIHPLFDDSKPRFDIALIRLSHPVKYTPNLHSIRMKMRPSKIMATHFIVTAWQSQPKDTSEEIRQEEMDAIKRRRLLSVSHLHPTDPDDCSEQLRVSGFNHSSLMCLDLAVGIDPCERQVGAPVVLNDILWGIISSWKPEDCEVDPGATFVSLVSDAEISSWIRQTRNGLKKRKEKRYMGIKH